MRLFVDDLRIPPEGWELARTITEAIQILSTNHVEALSLDHDIFDDDAVIPKFSVEDFSSVARFVKIMRKRNQPKVIFLHTANQNGALNMARILSTTDARIIRISPMGYAAEIKKYFNGRGKRGI